ncbi:substrate-binding domain-containing protein [uncultured Akkermansia sp.]|jgi:DNA-binding LacI/PurR family transcriptional regulator|uniref:substrate-binding domain-containing protein n=1 Tax=uncultured Akkermansia sp. TaxID=512294 RepID=UPI0025D7F616|nr:substrate-binding domain-containing protein [uncultured Akkermansia sp.]
MTSLPASSLVETVANKIKQMILSGSLVNILPGERELGNRLSVGRETVRKALALLERDAWIAPARIKVPRRILKTTEEGSDWNVPSHPVQEKRGIIGFLTPQSLKRLAQSVLAEIYTISKILEEDGISVRIFEAPWILGNNPDKRLAKLVTKSECVCWILHRSSEQTQLWFKTHGIPCIVRGTSYQSSNLPYLDRHWAATTHHAAQHLWNKGHRTVGLCLPPDPLKGHQLMQKGFFSFTAQGWNPVLIPTPFETPLFFEYLAKAFREHPDMSALVATRGNQIVPLLSWVEARSLSIPNQLSLVSLTYEPFMERLLPPITYYEENQTKTVHKLIRMLRALTSGKSIKSISVIPEIYPGQSVSLRQPATSA